MESLQKISKNRGKEILFILLLLFSIFSIFILTLSLRNYNSDNSLVLLASQFLKGHISLIPDKSLPLGDISPFNGRFYVYFGPFVSIVLMPFVGIFGKAFPQYFIGIGSMFFSFIGIYLLSKRFKFQKIDALWLALFFTFSTVLFSASVINISAYQVQALSVPLIVFSLYEYFNKKRPLLIGLFLGLAILTRLNLVLAIFFFIFEFIQKRLNPKQLFYIFVPVIVCLTIFFAYNFIRFHSFLETGYIHATAYKTYPQSLNFEFGATSLRHIPANLYSFLVKPPDPLLENEKGFVLKFPYLKANPWGMAIWFTSPLFLFLLFKFRKNKYTISAILTSVILAIPIITYYSVGFAQFGYRYTLDFLPFLFLILIPSLLPSLDKKAILLITIGVLFNCFYIASLWRVYPLFGIQ